MHVLGSHTVGFLPELTSKAGGFKALIHSHLARWSRPVVAWHVMAEAQGLAYNIRS